MEIETPREEEPNGEGSGEPAETALNVDTGEKADKRFFRLWNRIRLVYPPSSNRFTMAK